MMVFGYKPVCKIPFAGLTAVAAPAVSRGAFVVIDLGGDAQ